MHTFADRVEDKVDNTNNSREEMLSIEAMEQKVEALRQQVSQASQDASVPASDVSATLVPQTSLQQEPAIEIIDQITAMFKEGGMSAKLMADTFGDQLTGVIGEMMRNEIKLEKHQKKLEELAAIIEVSRQQNLNMQNAATQNIAQLDSQRLASQLAASYQAISQIDSSLRQSLQSFQIDQSRIAEINRLQQNPNLLQQAQQLQAQNAVRINQASDLLVQNINSARQVSEIMRQNNAGAENVVQLSQDALKVVRQAIEQATVRPDSPAVNNPAINNQAIKDSVAKLDTINNDLLRAVYRGTESQQVGNSSNLIAEKANNLNAIELNRSVQQQVERTVQQQQVQQQVQQQAERVNQIQQQAAARVSQEIATKQITATPQVRPEVAVKPELKQEVKQDIKVEKNPIREIEKLVKQGDKAPEIKNVIPKEVEKSVSRIASNPTSEPEKTNPSAQPKLSPKEEAMLRRQEALERAKQERKDKPPTYMDKPTNGCPPGCGGGKCPGCPATANQASKLGQSQSRG